MTAIYSSPSSGCSHIQFFEVSKIQECMPGCRGCYLDPGNPSARYVIAHEQRYGVKVVCAHCGQKRNLWDVGPIEVIA